MATATTTETKAAPATAAFNYYTLPTSPELDDVTVVMGTSPAVVSCQVPVVDLRGTALSDFTHESHGFQVLRQPLPIDASHASVHDTSTMANEYYPAMVALLKQQLGVRCAVVINSTLRDIPGHDASTIDPKNPRPTTGTRSLGPFFVAHSDYTPGAARAHLRAMTPDWFDATGTGDGSTTPEDRALFLRLRSEIIAAEDRAAGLGTDRGGEAEGKGGHWAWDGRGYEGPRYAMFSIWRPWETVRRDPLAVLVGGDGCAAGDAFPYVALPRVYRSRPGCVPEYYNENALVRPPTADTPHVWGYLGAQAPDEVLALKFYDSEALRRGDGSVRGMCPHSAFHTPDMDDEPTRRSCELRVWCVW
ncbi:GA4 desaturase [Hypoxylon sp. FL1284]|nr:GA4 desaturase [Hypoxylon sp. FL1284]